MNLTLVISSLGGGGAERAISIMANYWVQKGKNVTLLTFDNSESSSYPLHPGIRHRPLKLAAHSGTALVALFRNFHRLQVLRRAVRASRPDMVISFMDKTNILTLLATRGLGTPVIVSERTDPSQYDIGRIWCFLRRVTYPLANLLICQSAAALAYFDSFMATKGFVIPNPVTPPPVIPEGNGHSWLGRNDRQIIAMGALIAYKGFDLLLEAFGSVALKHPEWSLKILGEGPLRRELEKKVEETGLSGKVQFYGRITNPFPALQKADLFVLSSRFEGFPNALCEAMACGLPVVSFDCPSGPREIIRDGVDGVLVPAEDVNALAATLDRLMGDFSERRRLANRAPEVLSRFGLERIMDQWDELMARVIG